MRHAGSASTVLLPLLLILGASPSSHGATSHNITDMLAAHPDFSEFSAALTSTGAAAVINNQGTITVLALDNAAMAQLKAQKLQPRDLQHVIYLHGLTDYFDATKLRSIRGGSAQVTSLYQATGKAQTNEGMVSITVLSGGRVEFALSTNTLIVPAAIYKKSIKEVPYDFAVLQVSAPIWSPAPPPSSPGHGTAPASSPAHAPPPAPAPASSPAHAPPPAPAAPASSPAAQAPTPPPAVAPPAIPPTPRRHPAPPKEAETPADSPDADSEPPADQKSNGARDTASWSLGMAVAAAVPVILLLLL
jgi:hypothetical protein